MAKIRLERQCYQIALQIRSRQQGIHDGDADALRGKAAGLAIRMRVDARVWFDPCFGKGRLDLCARLTTLA